MSNFSLLITDWYRLNCRNLPWRKSKNPYLIWLSEIILQQTRVDQGKEYYLKFKRNYPTVHDLANANEQEILKDWQGLGYYSRARNLHASAKIISADLNGVFPDKYDEIIKLKGVGSYTAAAISSIAFEEKRAVVDGNVYRVLSRIFDIDTPIDSTFGKKEFQKIADQLIQDDQPGQHNQAMMELGALVCKPTSPNCLECPMESQCLALKNNTINQRPIKTKKVKTRERHFQFLVFSDGEHTIIEQRGEKDIWRNMFQFPLIESKSFSSEKFSAKSKESGPIKHILSHQKIFGTFHHFDEIPSDLSEKWKIIKWSDLSDYPIPRLIDKYLESQ